MNEALRDTIHLFSCGAKGIEPVIRQGFDIEKVLQKAASQGVSQVLFCAILKLVEANLLVIDPVEFAKLNNVFLSRVMVETNRRNMLHTVIQRFEEDNIEYCVIKGEVLADLYKEPICRVSADTDILVKKNHIDKALGILQSFGFEIGSHDKHSYHIGCSHPIAGTIEIHYALYREVVNDIIFLSVEYCEDYRRLILKDGFALQTMGVTDGLVYITLHLIKHFLGKGVGIRQMLDLLLYMEHYHNQINWEYYKQLLARLKYFDFIRNLIGIGIRYMSFSQAAFPPNYVLFEECETILDDMDDGGLFGKENEQREAFLKVYIKERFYKLRSDNYDAYMKEKYSTPLLSLLLPGLSQIKNNFPYLARMPWLLPFAWVHRAWLIVTERRESVKNVKRALNSHMYYEDNEILQKRLELIKRLDML